MDDFKAERRVFWWLSAIFAGLIFFCFLTAVWSDNSVNYRLTCATTGVITLMPTVEFAFLSKKGW
jgi:uncharacterized membrane protein YhaH (DUF805 family)